MTEKTVAYYEEIVRQEIANKTLSFGCKIQYIFENELSRIGTYLEPGLRNEPRFYVWSGSSIEEMHLSECKILGHEIRPHHILQWVKNRNGYSYISNGGKLHIEISPHNVLTITSRDPSKPFSEQSDDTKVVLGKVVEEVLSCKDK